MNSVWDKGWQLIHKADALETSASRLQVATAELQQAGSDLLDAVRDELLEQDMKLPAVFTVGEAGFIVTEKDGHMAIERVNAIDVHRPKIKLPPADVDDKAIAAGN
jgi:hypothetical protein